MKMRKLTIELTCYLSHKAAQDHLVKLQPAPPNLSPDPHFSALFKKIFNGIYYLLYLFSVFIICCLSCPPRTQVPRGQDS